MKDKKIEYEWCCSTCGKVFPYHSIFSITFIKMIIHSFMHKIEWLCTKTLYVNKKKFIYGKPEEDTFEIKKKVK